MKDISKCLLDNNSALDAIGKLLNTEILENNTLSDSIKLDLFEHFSTIFGDNKLVDMRVTNII